MKTKLFAAILALALILTSCATEPEPVVPTPVDFSKAGMTVTLDDTFVQKEYAAYTLSCESADIVMFALKEEYTLFENTDFGPETTPEDYAQLVWYANQFTDTVPLKTVGDLQYFDYTKTSNGNDYLFRTYVFKDAEGFWLVQFACLTDRFGELVDTMHSYASTVTFDQPYTPPADEQAQ